MIGSNSLTNGLILKVDEDGQIKEVVFNSLTENINLKNKNLSNFIDEGSLKKYFSLLKEVQKDDVVFGRELGLNLIGKTESYILTVLNNLDSDSIIIAANQSEDMIKYYEELMKINNEYVNSLRSNIKEKTSKNKPAKDEEIYNEMSRLNNKLVNLQRQLNKQNLQLKAEKEKYRVTLSSIAEGVITADHKNNIVYLNSKAEKMLGWSLDDAKGKKCRDIFKVSIKKNNGHDLELISEEISAVEEDIKIDLSSLFQKKEEINNQEAILISKNNNSIPIEFSAAKVVENQGKVIIFRDISARKDTEQRLRKYAATDLLTEVLNRRAGLDYLQEEMNLAEANNFTLSVIFIDVNDLKSVNDNFGHQEGDKLLQQVSNVMQNSLRRNDMVVRLGGDEFLLILPQSDKEAAEKIWNRVRKDLKQLSKSNDKDYEISVSHGSAEYSPNYKKSLDQLINKADHAMYEEKKKMKSKDS